MSDFTADPGVAYRPDVRSHYSTIWHRNGQAMRRELAEVLIVALLPVLIGLELGAIIGMLLLDR